MEEDCSYPGCDDSSDVRPCGSCSKLVCNFHGWKDWEYCWHCKPDGD